MLLPEEALWQGNRGKALTANAVRMVFRKLSGLFGERVWCHRMRATSATLRLIAGASFEVVRSTLGHADEHSIQSYIKLAQSDIETLIDDTSPLKMVHPRQAPS